MLKFNKQLFSKDRDVVDSQKINGLFTVLGDRIVQINKDSFENVTRREVWDLSV